MSSLIDYAPVTNGEGLETSILGLHFRASSSHLKHGVLKLRCTATIAAVYYRENTRVAAGRLTERSHRPESHGIFAGKLDLIIACNSSYKYDAKLNVCFLLEIKTAHMSYTVTSF